MSKKVLAAMSGGVDSSVAVRILQQQGFDCAGATMLLHGSGHEADGSQDDVADAGAVALRLGIPHYVFDFSGEFNSCVLQKFAGSYLKGDTPNPCIDCNRHMKFGAFLRRAVEMGFDYIATGHYARIARDTGTGLFSLRKALDRNRDQSYVLASALSQERLRRVLFPLGDLTKSQVRQIAEEQGFLNARKHDSQDICFVPDGDYGAFLERYTGKTCPPGDILDPEGRVIGRHKGAVRYTAGQRKGLGIAADRPLYVCKKSMEDNTLTVGPETALYARSLLAGDWEWGTSPLPEPREVLAKVRYRQAEQPALAEPLPDGRVRITFRQPQRAVTTGQAAVLYEGDTVLGGGTILEVLDG